MANGIQIVAELEPKNNGEFHLLEDIYLKGSYRIVQNITERNAISTLRRKNGMKVYSIDDATEYQLVLGTINQDINNNGNWIEVISNGTSIDDPIQFFTVNNDENGIVFKKGNLLCWKQNIISDEWIMDYSNYIPNDSVDDIIELVGIYNSLANLLTNNMISIPIIDIDNSTITIDLFFENKGYIIIKLFNDAFAQTIQFN